MTDKIKQQKKNMYDHIMWMKVGRLPKVLVNYKAKCQKR
jgi:hypothetical protein